LNSSSLALTELAGLFSPKSSRCATPGTASDLVGRNSIVVRTGAFAQVWSNTITGNFHGPTTDEACGILVLDGATVNFNKQNTLRGNELDFYSDSSNVVGKNVSP
jgi:hypothetical protein